MRVITGLCKGKKLKTMEGLNTRPTSDRVKEALFNILSKKIINSICLDLFSGSGNLGIEAISRGASECTFIENNKTAFSIIKDNIKALKFESASKLINQDAFEILKFFKNQSITFDIIFLDPPYSLGLVEEAIVLIDKFNLLKDNGIIISEYDVKDEMPPKIGNTKIYRTEKYGRTIISFWSKE